WSVWAGVTTVGLLLGLVYPYAGNDARREGFKRSPTLDGLGWLRQRAPGDVKAIAWIRAHTPGDAVVLEAVGPDYSAFGHSGISPVGFHGLRSVNQRAHPAGVWAP